MRNACLVTAALVELMDRGEVCGVQKDALKWLTNRFDEVVLFAERLPVGRFVDRLPVGRCLLLVGMMDNRDQQTL